MLSQSWNSYVYGTVHAYAFRYPGLTALVLSVDSTSRKPKGEKIGVTQGNNHGHAGGLAENTASNRGDPVSEAPVYEGLPGICINS